MLYNRICSQNTGIGRVAFLSWIVLIVILFQFSGISHSAEVTLEWDPNTEPDLAGYRIYYGFESENYTYTIDVGNQTSYTVPDLESDRLYYFAATSYDVYNNESEFSEEVSYLVPSENEAPVADAGPDQSVAEGATVTLNGSNSIDANNDIVGYLWEQVSGPEVELVSPDSAAAAFIAPDVGINGSSLSFLLTVTDSAGLSSEDSCIVNVTWVNLPPLAVAGDDQTVYEGELVTLNASGSSDPDDGIAYYMWEQVEGPAVALSDPGDIQPTFTAPDLDQGDLSLTFQLTVEDHGGLRTTDTCVVNVSWVNSPPVAEAGEDQIVNEGDTVTLDGSGSWDPDDGIVSFRWTQTGGSPVALSDPTGVTTTFTAPVMGADSGPMTFQISVTDAGGLTSQDTCVVTVAGATVYEDAEDGTTKGWSIYDKKPKKAKISNVFDDLRQSRVIQLKGKGTANGYVLRNEDGSRWHNTTQFVIQWSMRYKEYFRVYLDVQTTAGHRYLYYTPSNDDWLGDGKYVHHGLGSNITDGYWHTFTRDLQADLNEAQPGVELLEINGFLIRGTGRVDSIQLLDSIPSETIYEDGEDGDTEGWHIYDDDPSGATVTNVFDDDRQSRVIEFKGSGTSNGYRFSNHTEEARAKWHNSEQFTIQWSMKYKEHFVVYLDVETTAGHRYIYYTPDDYDNLGSGEYVHYGLGSLATEGQWNIFTRDLKADLEDAQPGVTILEVNGFLIRGSGRVDDIQLLSK